MIHVCRGLDPPPANKPGLIAKTVDSHSSSEVKRDVENEKERSRRRFETVEG